MSNIKLNELGEIISEAAALSAEDVNTRITELNSAILRDEYAEARVVYGKIKKGELSDEALREYIVKWRKMETLRMTIGTPFDRSKLYQSKVPEYAQSGGELDELANMSDIDLANEGRLIAHEAHSVLKGIDQKRKARMKRKKTEDHDQVDEE